MGFFSAIKSTLSSSLTKLAQAPKQISNDFLLTQAIASKRVEVSKLEKKLVQLERSTDSFSAATGQRVERADVQILRQQVNYKKAELANLERARAQDGIWYQSSQEIASKMRY